MSDFLIIDDNKKNVDKKDVSNKKKRKSISFTDRINDFVLNLQKVKVREKAVFYRLLSIMTHSGMSLIKSVSSLQKQEKNPVFKKILGRLCEELKSGKNLSEGLELYETSFTEAEIGIIRSGEKTGGLNKSLTDLANQIEKIESISGKIKSAMLYPIFIICSVVVVVAVMMIMVVPRLLDIFDDKDALPVSTKILMSLSSMFQAYWFLIFLVCIGFVVFIHIWKKTPDGKYMFDKLLLKVPIFGDITRKLALSKFARVFAGLLSSGVSVVESLKITADAVGNEVYKQRILLLSSDVQKGIKIWESLDGDTLFPEVMIQMIQVGEQTAKLDTTIVKIGELYDQEIDNTINVLHKLLEPFIIVFLALVVGFIAIAIMQPIMDLADIIGNT